MDQIEQLRIDGEALLAAARIAGPDAAIEHCPGWSMQRLVSHTARVFERTAVVVSENLMSPPPSERFTQFARDASVFEQYEQVLVDLVSALKASPLDAPSWNFTGEDLTTSFWIRRMANEAAVHRWDAQHAAGTAEPFDPELAVDIIDELLFVLMPVLSATKNPALSSSFHIHCTDTTGEWRPTFRDEPRTCKGRSRRARSGQRTVPVGLEPPAGHRGRTRGVRRLRTPDPMGDHRPVIDGSCHRRHHPAAALNRATATTTR